MLGKTIQPGGLSDSSRWSQRSVDHRIMVSKDQHPEGCQNQMTEEYDEKYACEATGLLHPCWVPVFFSHHPVVCASLSTTGYYLRALRAQPHS